MTDRQNGWLSILPQLIVTVFWFAFVIFFTFAVDDGVLQNQQMIKMFVTAAPGISALVMAYWFMRK